MNRKAIVLWELVEHGGPLLLGNYRPARGLGDLTIPSSLTIGTDTASYALLGGAAALLVLALVLKRNYVKVPRRKKAKRTSTGPRLVNVLPWVALGVGGAYLIGQSQGGQVTL